MDASTALLLIFTGLLVGAILGFFGGTFWMQRTNPQQHPPTDLRPLAQALRDLQVRLEDIDKEQAVAQSALAGQVQAIARTSSRLGDRTDQLITALRSPQVRGRWGEVQLQRVVELGGMVEHVDFDAQAYMRFDGASLRPDMVIRLTQDRNIIVDAKVPFSSYLDALNTEDPEEKQGYLRRHAHLLRSHVDTLSSKSYIKAFQPSPEFVVMFVPADPFLDAGLAIDPELLDYAFARNVVIATPTTLFALLRTVELGWRQDSMNREAQTIQRLGEELYRRLGTLTEHYNRVGSSLEKAVESYNATLASLDSRVMVTARKLEELGAAGHSSSAPEFHPIDARPRLRDSDSSNC